ncbi:flagellar hook-basal body complex protein FliE [Candidatus Kuenenia stuttgartiensis]|jgi:flagellar hook-basal body complex protein FliE|uniref:Flagellar hook-basal body complex protein FliE n=1 Tax=Kuenenia stuttgartiensis TaxID=174633 RepID=Q1PYK3_KUEST|nr:MULTISPECIES: flagellar hook-basal body complex protein FliE [Kuenenia]MBE7547545.1 flagellar hook-basal body complex protein FliE [Planctomycetia bacterium]MBW7942519.1 flagellar hook-basal body complex protein FliE [Candidatus Kuenenia stuttgartiensis]MBZ0190801.1 flagellar hook-basal body complex protein FliE [Candidatus Kuenenia stuttgartiensis]MCF6152096.1 flagellar hook-basal body complex protein FliE [Candidatus Kuenenia stuttgartiensis]MCL4726564.1 flagellar hook-basal body complex 
MAVLPINNNGDSIQQNKGFDFVEEQKGASFKDTLGGFINEINDLQVKASDSIEKFSGGKIENIHEVMVAMSKAEVSFKFMMETRNKLVETYKEVMRMQM